MTPRDAILKALGDPFDTDDVLDALAEAGFVIVACPPGSRVVVSRESKPCPEVYRSDLIHGDECETCGGSGVVEATTTHGLAEFGGQVDWHTEDGVGVWVRTFRLVALPEDGE